MSRRGRYEVIDRDGGDVLGAYWVRAEAEAALAALVVAAPELAGDVAVLDTEGVPDGR